MMKRRIFFLAAALFILVGAGTFLLRNTREEPRETQEEKPIYVVQVGQVQVPIDLSSDDEELMTALRSLPSPSVWYALDRDGVVVATDSAGVFPKIEIIGLVSPGDRYPFLTDVEWSGVIDQLQELSGSIDRLFVIDGDLVTLVDGQEPFVLLVSLSNFERSIATAIETSHLLAKEGKVLRRLDARFSRPLIHLKEVI